MTINDTKDMIKKGLDKDYVLIAPQCIQETNLVHDYTTLELYENMHDNTKQFVSSIYQDLSEMSRNIIDPQKTLKFNLVFEGSMEEIRNFEGSFTEFVMANKERIVAIYKFVKDKRKNYYVDFRFSEEDLQYDYVFLSLDEMIKEFNEVNISYEIDESLEDVPSYFRDLSQFKSQTKFEIGFNKEKDDDKEKNHSL